ncbi:ATP-binding protein [Gordonia sp. TBRC 11910]|uniref:ATP-binding protein n=1 Tax=Gordonia asplenii TaxID=2725283 RepID=A0A848L030_9ACTN|nr:AAA family ATPase [Gordonia asplenii]NMO04320.1 ATP-binding protein [Gordonia asplenii]
MNRIHEGLAVTSGQPVLVVAVSTDRRRLDIRYPNGNTGFITARDPDVFAKAVGDIILIDGNTLHDADLANWPEPSEVGIVRRIYDDRLLIEGDYKLNLVPNREPESVALGQTVVFSESVGIKEKLDNLPVSRRNVEADSEVEGDKYLWKSDPENMLSFEDFGGYPEVVARARELIEIPLQHGDKLQQIGARPIKGVLFTGAPGTGKTHLARIVADQSNAAFYSISGPEVISKWVGDSEGNLRRLFESANSKSRAIVFFDEIDGLAEKRSEESHESSKRVVAQLLTLMDGFEGTGGNLMVIAATNRPDDIDPALRRPGRFDWEINFPLPSLPDRLEILQVSMKHLSVADPSRMPLEEVAEQSEGWSAARLASLWTEAALLAAGDGRGALYPEDLVSAFERLRARRQDTVGTPVE